MPENTVHLVRHVSEPSELDAPMRSASLVVLTFEAHEELKAILGGPAALEKFLIKKVDEYDRPIAWHAPARGDSMIGSLGPKSWTGDQVEAWVRAHGEVLAAVFS